MSGTTSRSASRPALPGLAAGALGLAAGVLGLAVSAPAFGAVAGVLALAAGVAGLRLAQQLEEQAAVQILIEDELRTIRQEARSTEAHLRQELETVESRMAIAPGADGFEALDEADPSDPLIDEATGLFSENFFLVALDSRVAAARRHLRPVAVVLLTVVEGLPIGDPVEADINVVATAITTTLREADTACRLRNGDFALLLEDTPENGAIWTVERIRRGLTGQEPKLTMWAGVACYPAHAFSSAEILKAADHALEAAREWRQDRIEVAVAAAD